jgi:hypothetical protein
VRSSILKGVAVALVAAAVLVPAAAAKPHHQGLDLALVPLPKARLGSAAAGLQIAPASGPRFDVTGRHVGYTLAYGSLFHANPGLDEVATGVVEYKTVRAARRALVHDKKEYFSRSGFIGNLTQLNLTATEASLTVPAVGDGHFAALLALSVANYGSVYLVDEEFRDGKHILDLAVAAGSQDLATSYAASKARILDNRLHLGLNGRLHGHPVALPKRTHPGPPADGPDPKTAALQTSDLPGSAIDWQGYDYVYGALSTYELGFEPGGSFAEVDQIVNVMPSTNSAGFLSAFLGAYLIAFSLDSYASDSPQVTPVDVSAVGDEAQAAIVSGLGAGSKASQVVVTLHSGSVADIVIAQSSTTINPSAVQTLAQAAATRLDAALP